MLVVQWHQSYVRLIPVMTAEIYIQPAMAVDPHFHLGKSTTTSADYIYRLSNIPTTTQDGAHALIDPQLNGVLGMQSSPDKYFIIAAA